MLNLRTAETLISLISFFIAYLFMVSGAGYVRAWTAKKMGDDTPERLGFLTLNPMVHIDPVGLVFLLLPYFRFGWGRHITINPNNILRPYRKLKLCLAYYSDVVAYFVMAVGALTSLIALFGPTVLLLSKGMILSGNLSQLMFASAYPETPSLIISIALILIAWVYLSVFLAVFNFILSSLELGMMMVLERSPEHIRYTSSFTFLLPVILIFSFVSPVLRVLMVQAISYTGYFLAQLLGLL